MNKYSRKVFAMVAASAMLLPGIAPVVEAASTIDLVQTSETVRKVDKVEVKKAIYNLPRASELTLVDKAKVEEVRNMVDNLSDEDKEFVTTISQLEAREDRITELEDKRDATQVKRRIYNLPKASELTLKDKEAVEEVRVMYDDLSEEAKALVTTISQLEAREAKLDELSEGKEGTETIISDEMTVKVDTDFPRVIDYTMTDGKIMHGQSSTLDTITVNDVDIKPEVTSALDGDNKIIYTIKVKATDENVDAVLTAEFEVVDNTLAFRITDIDNLNEDQSVNENLVRTIEIPNHSLVSVRSEDGDAELMGAKMANNTVFSGDTKTVVDENLTELDEGYMYAFVSDDDLSAGLASNSQTEKYGDFNRVHADATEHESFNSVGLSSSEFVYHRDVTFGEDTLNLPEVEVAITGDVNNDGQVDWQDGAVAFRDIMYLPEGAEEVKDLVAYRIAMNFGSHAQNPFLMMLDNVKKVNANTDGLGQSILIKGYGNEGHDSGHLNYKDIGRRMGGVDEFRDLLDQSVDYGASIGIHVNASETYPESPYFEEDRLMKDANGNYSYGWNWLDQGININAKYDLANGRRERFEDLAEVIGGEDNNLGWVYVDVWGNGQSGDNGSWTSHELAKEVMDQGWRLGGEWGYAFEPDSTFQHWAADVNYGGHNLKGINSDVTRFIFNGYRDAWNADYAQNSGSSDNPLLGGYDMKDFEGWQGRNDYGGYIENLFETNLSTKFVQHFDATRWIEGEPVTMPNPGGGTVEWTPEMEVHLEGDDGLGTLVIERKSNDYENDKEGYRGRTMKLDDRLILDDDTYLIPWNWDSTGNDLDSDEEKLYHFNKQGGETTWDLPSDWDVSDVKVYQLTEIGRKLVDTVDVIDNKVTLNAEEGKTYTVYKGEQAPIEVTYGKGAHIIDPHFNTTNLDAWDVDGDGAEVVKSQATNDMLRIQDNTEETNVSQVLTDLTPGEDYVAYVGVDNRSDEAARITVDFDGEEVSEYTNKSIAKNYVQAYGHNTNSSTINDNSYFQNMFVYFTAPEEETDVRLTLSRDAGEDASYFDDVRITENKGDPHIEEDVYFQDFEEAAQGIAPFVVGDIEGVQDNRTHLSEFNAPYTQRGWNGKVISDVIDGDWSVKTNGLTGRNRLVYQTIPQNVRFEKGQSYKVSFDYEAGSEGTYAFVVGDGEYDSPDELTKHGMSETWMNSDTPGKASFIVEGADTGQTWVGIFSTKKGADTQGDTGGLASFKSYNDFMLDNVRIEPVELTSELLIENYLDNLNPVSNSDQYTNKSLNNYKEKLLELFTNKSKDLSVEEAQELINNANDARSALEKINFNVSMDHIESLDAHAQPGNDLAKAFDNNESSLWHTPWAGGHVGEPATIVLKEPTKITRFEYLPRPDGSNGTFKAGTLEIIDAEENVHEFEFSDWEPSNKTKTIEFEKIINAVEIILTPTQTYGEGGDKFASAAELRFELSEGGETSEVIDYGEINEALSSIADIDDLESENKYLFDLLKIAPELEKYDLLTSEEAEKILTQVEKILAS